jgi:hypothetical protein
MSTNVTSQISQIIQLATGYQATNAQLTNWQAAIDAGGTSLLDVAKAFIASTMFANNYHVDNSPVTPPDLLPSGAFNIPGNLTPAAPIPFADTLPTAQLTAAIIDHGLFGHTDAQLNAWMGSGDTVAQVFEAFALNDHWATYVGSYYSGGDGADFTFSAGAGFTNALVDTAPIAIPITGILPFDGTIQP